MHLTVAYGTDFSLVFVVEAHHTFSKEEVLGRVEVSSKDFPFGSVNDKWHDITLNGLTTGQIHLKTQLIPKPPKQGGNVVANSKFFNNVGGFLKRDYIVILDMSGSMHTKDGHHMSRWEHGEHAALQLAPFIEKANLDGFTLYLFNHTIEKYPGIVQDNTRIKEIFARHQPHGSTNLANVLNVAFESHFQLGRQTSILVITDGEPDSQPDVYDAVERAANRMQTPYDMSCTFIQIGHDEGASCFLEALHTDNKCRFPIVDCISYRNLKHIHFHDLIREAINHHNTL